MKRSFLRFMLVVSVLSCASGGGGGRYYDADHGDYHTFSGPELTVYTQWETSTNRPHQDFGKRSAADQKEYFNYAHTQHSSQKAN
jgi:hypothetical protein